MYKYSNSQNKYVLSLKLYKKKVGSNKTLAGKQCAMDSMVQYNSLCNIICCISPTQ